MQALGREGLARDADAAGAVDGAGKNEHVVFGVIVGTGHGGGIRRGLRVPMLIRWPVP